MIRRINRPVSWLFVGLAAINLVACNEDDKKELLPPEEIKLNDNYTTTRSTVLIIKPEVTGYEAAAYKWSLTQTPEGAVDSLISEELELEFITIQPGTYALNLEVTQAGEKEDFAIDVLVEQEAEAFSPYLAEVLDYLPGVGQFVNKLPSYEEGDTQASMIAKTSDLLAGEDASMITLGGFGGYVTFRFDHTVANLPGKRDFRVKGNAFGAASNPQPDAPFGGSCEPGVIMVAYDKNQNGEADPEEWYEIAGSAHHSVSSEAWYCLGKAAGNDLDIIPGYEITYFRPTEEPDQAIEEYIRWEDNQGNSGFKVKNAFHRQSYFPAWIEGDSYTLKGTRLPENGIDESGQGNYYVLYGFGFGYADNYPNAHDNSAIDIAWAVDAEGNPVHLPGVDFVRVHSGVNQENGWLGECSTEIAGAEDLHLLGEVIDSEK